MESLYACKEYFLAFLSYEPVSYNMCGLPVSGSQAKWLPSPCVLSVFSSFADRYPPE